MTGLQLYQAIQFFSNAEKLAIWNYDSNASGVITLSETVSIHQGSICFSITPTPHGINFFKYNQHRYLLIGKIKFYNSNLENSAAVIFEYNQYFKCSPRLKHVLDAAHKIILKQFLQMKLIDTE